MPNLHHIFMAQAMYSSGSEIRSLIIFALVLLVSIGIFLALRAFFLWYWKVNIIIKNQELQNRLLSELITVNKRTIKPQQPVTTTDKI